MADQKKWFKLWCSAPADDDLQALPPAIRWAWAAFGAYTKEHGTEGTVIIRPTNASLAAQMGVTLDVLISTLKLLPHVRVEESEKRDGEVSVTWHNWKKYQEDSTHAERQKKYRDKKRDGLRGEEIRGDKEKEDIHTTSGLSVRDLVDSWNDGFKGLLAAVEWPLAESRHRKVLLRLREHPAIEYWQQVFQNIADSGFLLGKTGTWRCSFDFIIANDNNCNKIYEGQYSNGKQTVGAARR